MLKPTLWLNRITDISVQELKRLNITALLLDVDNTLSTHHGSKVVNGFYDWKNKMQENGIKLLILSNSKKARVEPFAKKVGLEYISLALKPLPFGYIRGAKKLNTPLKNTAIAGDQIFTDVLGAKILALKVILLEPIKTEEKLSFKIRRKGEKYLKNHFKKKGWF